ncbi:MAG: metalloprotease [Clostridiales bacterium]|nr:metalloprotease [Clostridiales bacterium]
MKWEGRRRSTNVNDRRGRTSAGRRMAVGGGSLGVVGIVVYLLITLLSGGGGGDLGDILGGAVLPGSVQTDSQQQSTYVESEQERELMGLLSVALADIEDTWSAVLPASQYQAQYREPELTVYTGAINTACGAADAGVGPFYCPGDQTIYLDLSFYDTLTRKYGAKEGDFAMVYVIAHEAGHHVQTLLGVTSQLNDLRQRVARGAMSQTEFNRYSVAFELQADYLAGVVARYMQERGYLERGDLSEAMSAAASVGDDAIQRRYQGYVDPDTFNHGTSEQRQEWFRRGFEAGDLSGWDTFRGL